jgi:hypothetical protein
LFAIFGWHETTQQPRDVTTDQWFDGKKGQRIFYLN